MTFTKTGDSLPFFKAFEDALESRDLARLAEIYHTSFLFGGPSGAQTVKLEDFLNVVPKRTAFAKSLGLSTTRLASVEQTALDETYTLAKVVWKMTVEKKETTHEVETEASYVLLRQGGGYRIVAQIDHQDLMTRIQEFSAPSPS